ncbi:MAG TPA: glycosyltransferase [Bacteroidia bacterium]|nr:glycosyltransferase [Bacteroidia bacterium]
MNENTPLRIVLLAKQDTSPYFTYQALAGIFRSQGYSATIADSAETIPAADIVITHNTYGFAEGTLNEVARKGIRVVSFMDNPMDKFAFLETIDPSVILVFTDPAHIPLAREIVGNKNRIIDHPLDIAMFAPEQVKPLAERTYDLLFVGRLVTFGSVNEYSFLERRLARQIVEATLHSTEKLIHEIAIEAFQPYKKMFLYRKEFISEYFLKYCWKLSHAVRREKRMRVLNELKKADKELNIAFVSNDSAALKKEFGAHHSFFDFMPWSSVVNMMGDSKVVVNTMPSRMECLHERLVETMFSGAVCLTDVNRKIKADFADRKNIVTFNYRSSNLSDALKSIIRKDTELQSIADAGRQRIAELVNENNWIALVQKIVAGEPDLKVF